MTELSETGLLKIAFSQEMQLIDFSAQNSAFKEGLSLKLLPNESNEFIEEKDSGFEWTVTQFEDYSMQIQIEWNNPTAISSGLQRDQLFITVTDPSLFFSGQSMRSIPLNTTVSINIPKMMPNTEFIENFSAFSVATEQATTAAIIGNFLINIIL